MNSNSKITIFCSNYNSAKWIDEYLEYLKNQIDKNFEIVFIDANSTDESLNKIKIFASNTEIKTSIIECDKRIGIYEAWNLGIKLCNTDYVMNYNTDDMLHKYAISVYNYYIKNYPSIDLFYGPCPYVKNRNICDISQYFNWPEYSHETMLQYCFCGPFPLVKKEVFEKIGYFDETFISSGDYEMWLRMSKHNNKFMKIPEIIGSYYHRNDSISCLNPEKTMQEDNFLRNKHR